MTPEQVIQIGRHALEVTSVLAGLVLLPALAVGLLVSLVQAVTQINEMTMTFIPTLIVVGVILVVAGPWMLQYFIHYSVELFQSIPELIQQ